MLIEPGDVIRTATQSPAPAGADSTSFWDRLWPVFLGAVFAFLFSLAIALLGQLVVVPRVEGRKRREERWERDVLTLGELLTAEIPSFARASRRSAYVMQKVHQNTTDEEHEPGEASKTSPARRRVVRKHVRL